MASASCKISVTEFETKDMVPNHQLVPIWSSAAAPKVMSSTGTSPKLREVRSSTPMTMMTATMPTYTISSMMLCAMSSPPELETAYSP